MTALQAGLVVYAALATVATLACAVLAWRHWRANALDGACQCAAWRRWRITHKVASHLYGSGLAVTGGGYTMGNGHDRFHLTSLPKFRWGERPYVLWVKWDTWRCLLRGGPNGRHRPGDPIGFGYCSKCLPCPDCGSETAGHDDDCPTVSHLRLDVQTAHALDVIAEPDRRRAEHMNRTLRRAEGGDEHE